MGGPSREIPIFCLGVFWVEKIGQELRKHKYKLFSDTFGPKILGKIIFGVQTNFWTDPPTLLTHI